MRRRPVIGGGLAAVAGGAAISLSRSKDDSPWRFFTADEAIAVDAICEQLIPADRDAGAREAGAVNFIDIQLTGPYRRYQATYRKGLASVDARSRGMFSKPFSALASENQVQVLREVERQDKAFFDLILNHARQGFYGDPRHGGNRGRVSWKMLGLSFPPVRGRAHYDDSPKQG
jgi:gluconate 2-dehydrogenase gamma chain